MGAMGGTTEIRIMRTGGLLALLALTMLIMSMLLFISVPETKFLLAASPIFASAVVVLVVAIIAILASHKAQQRSAHTVTTVTDPAYTDALSGTGSQPLDSDQPSSDLLDGEAQRILSIRRLASYGVGLAIVLALGFAIICAVVDVATQAIVFSLLISLEGPAGLALAFTYLTRIYKRQMHLLA